MSTSNVDASNLYKQLALLQRLAIVEEMQIQQLQQRVDAGSGTSGSYGSSFLGGQGYGPASLLPTGTPQQMQEYMQIAAMQQQQSMMSQLMQAQESGNSQLGGGGSSAASQGV